MCPQPRVPNSFLDGPRAMRFGDKSGHSDIQSLPEWEAVTVWEWQEVYGDPKTTRPHVLLVTVTGTPMSASEGKAGLLHGELGPIAETIYCRLRQKEFEYISMFPVCISGSGYHASQSNANVRLLIGFGSLALRPLAGTYFAG